MTEGQRIGRTDRRIGRQVSINRSSQLTPHQQALETVIITDEKGRPVKVSRRIKPVENNLRGIDAVIERWEIQRLNKGRPVYVEDPRDLDPADSIGNIDRQFGYPKLTE